MLTTWKQSSHIINLMEEKTTNMSDKNNKATIRHLIDKLIITGELELLTGMHIGSSKDFAPIGAVDSVVVRHPLTKEPIIPGSSIKGKMRSMLVKARAFSDKKAKLGKPDDDAKDIKRLFGSSEPIIQYSRLQFIDLAMSNVAEVKSRNTDLYLSEIKFENTISRLDGVANPRQIERVPAGSKFALKIVYNLESIEEAKEDFANIAKALQLIQLDYLGGHGSRGYGRVNLSNINIEAKLVNGKTDIKIDELKEELDKANDYGK